MSNKKITIEFDSPIMSGSISVAESKCGKTNCACKAKPPQLHGPFYRWTGVLNGKRTTKTISKEVARECERRIQNYRGLQEKIDQILEKALKNAPWNRK
jgi:hypothetical protein